MRVVSIAVGLGFFRTGFGGSRTDWAQGAQLFTSLHESKLKEIQEAIKQEGVSSRCPSRPWLIRLAEEVPDMRIPLLVVKPDEWIATGSGTRVYSYQNLVVKYLNDDRASLIEGLAVEHAALKLLTGTPGVPHKYDIFASSVEEEKVCSNRLSVVDRVGDSDLFDFATKVRGNTLYDLLSIAARAVEIIQLVHNKGIIHGDIHPGNLMITSSARDIGASLRLIDFGRARLFVNSQGDFVPTGSPVDYTYTPEYLSPWELKGELLAPREDLFRLAETLLATGGYSVWFDREVVRLHTECPHPINPKTYDGPCIYPRMAELKQSRQFDPDTPQVLIDFYATTIGLGPAQVVNYQNWANRFRTQARQLAHAAVEEPVDAPKAVSKRRPAKYPKAARRDAKGREVRKFKILIPKKDLQGQKPPVAA